MKKKDKDEKHDPKVAATKIEQEFAMIAEIPLGGSCSSKELQMGMIIEESTSLINTLLRESDFAIVGWTSVGWC